MALACTPAIVVLSGKYNLITLMTGISYERLNILHRYLGYICLGLGVVHSIAFAIAIYGDSNYWPLFEKFGSAEYTGLAVLVLLLFLTIFSIPWFRQHFYEAFASSHIAVYLIYIIFMFWHTANRIDTWMYLYATLAISLISNFSRLFLRLKTPRWNGSTATIQDIDGQMLKITIPAFNEMTWSPGQHVFLRFPGVSLLENHPFTIASLCGETYVTAKSGASTRTPLFFLVKSRKGLTKRLMRIAQHRLTLKVFIDGPYGGHGLNMSSRYEQVILVAGGSGISAVLPLFSMLCKRLGRANSTLRSIRLIWVIQNRHAQAWVQDEIKAALVMARRGTVEVDLYITRERNVTEQLDFSFEPDDIEMGLGVEDFRTVSIEDDDMVERQLIPKSADIAGPGNEDLDDCLSLDGLETEIGMANEAVRKNLDGIDDEDQQLMPSQSQNDKYEKQNPNQDQDYGIDVNIFYGRPDFQDIFPRLLVSGGRICVFSCGPQKLNIDISNAVAGCQTAVLRGRLREVRLWTETFGW